MIPISYNVRSLMARRSTTLAATLGIGLVVFVFAAMLMLSDGVEHTLRSSGSHRNAIVLRKGSQAETTSAFPETSAPIVRAAPEAAGAPNGSVSTAELVLLITARKADSPVGVTNLVVRGTRPESGLVHEGVRVTAGRPLTPGTHEVIVGRGLLGRFAGLEVGGEFALRPDRVVKVVGAFEAGGSGFESEIWADLDVLRGMFNRAGTVSSVTLRLRDADLFDALKARVEADPRLGLEVKREVTYYADLSQDLAVFIRAVGALIAVFFAAGAVIGAMITLYALVSQRSRELGTLRALGFRRRTLLASILVESLVLSLAGALVGITGALGMTLVSFSTTSWATFSELVFGFHATPGVLATAAGFAALMGALGGILPAVRAARVSPVVAMRG
jgi:putative ABC transport system permease protein